MVVVFALSTTCDRSEELLGKNTELPEYVAFIACDPAAKLEVVNLAVPPLSATVPMVFAPSTKVTVPVGVPEPVLGVTVAVKFTPLP